MNRFYSTCSVVILVGLLAVESLQSYGQTTGTWTKKTDIPGDPRYGAVAFSINGKGYMGTGSSGANRKDFYEYDPTNNSWLRLADFPGVARKYAVGFSIGNKGYVGTGDNGILTSANGGALNDFYELDPEFIDPVTTLHGKWTKVADFPGIPRFGSVGFSLGTKGYVGTGHLDLNLGDPAYRINDFWEFDPTQGPLGTWTEKSKIDGASGVPRAYAVGFAIGNKGYIGTGNTALSSPKQKDFWEYDPGTDTWTKKADLPGPARFVSVGLGIGAYGYIGTGDVGTYYASYGSYVNDFWEYNPTVDTWLQKLNFPDSISTSSAAFSIGNKGYIGTGTYGKKGGINTSEIFEYTAPEIVSIVPYSISQESINIEQRNGTITVTTQKALLAEIVVRNMLGQVIMRSKTNGNIATSISAVNLPNGVYIISLSSNKKIAGKKIFINK